MAVYVPIIHPVVSQATRLAERPWIEFFSQVITAVHQTQRGPHEQRLVLPAPVYGTVWYETDRGVAYYFDGAAWIYAWGEMTATLADQPTDLGASDAGFRFVVSDRDDAVVWTGTTWVMAPGAVLPGTVIDLISGQAPSAIGWAPMDGGKVSVLTLGLPLTLSSVATTVLPDGWIKR